MADAPYTTGNEILNYQGNANLAYGDGAVNYALNPNDLHPFSAVQDTIGKLQDQDARIRLLEYQDKIERQHALAQMLSEENEQGKNSVFNMKGPNGQNMSFTPLPEDKKILDKKADELTAATLANPNGYLYDANILQKKRELEYLTSHAGQRATFSMEANAQAAQSNDTDERNGIIQNRDAELKPSLTEYHPPTPFLGKLGWSNETFFPAKLLTDKDAYNPYSVQTKDQNGNIIKVEGQGLNDTNFDFRSKVRPNDQKIWSEANNMASSFFNSQLSKDPAEITKLNAEADAINSARGYVDANGNPVSIHAVPHIAEVAPDGTITYNTKNPADVAYALLAKTYGSVTPKASIQKDKIDVAKESESEKNIESQIGDRAEQNRIRWARLALDKQNAAKDPKLSKDERDQARIEADALQSNIFVYNQFKKWNTEGKALPDGVNKVMTPELTDLGVDPNKYVIKAVPSDATVKKLVSEPGTDLFSKATGRLKDMEKAYVLISKDGDPKEDILVGQFQNKGEKAPTLRVIPTSAAVENNIGSRTGGAKPTTRQVATMEAAQDHYGKKDGVWSTKRAAYVEPEVDYLNNPPDAVKKLGAPTKIGKSKKTGNIYYYIGEQWYDKNGNPRKLQ